MFKLDDLMRGESLELLKRALATDTQNPPGQEKMLASILRDVFLAAGFHSEIINEDGDRANVFAIDPNLLESDESLLCFNGHLDTVPVGELSQWQSDPLEARKITQDGKNYLIARGSCDMKAGLIASVCALVFAKRKNILKKPCLFLGTYDEESGGAGAEAFSKMPIFKRVDRMIICEPTSLKMGIASKGAAWLEFTISGLTCHGAYPEQGHSALEAAIELIEVLRNLLSDDDHPLLGPSTITPTYFRSGDKLNMVPDTAVIKFDLRLNPERALNDVISKMESKATEICRTLGCQLEMRVLNQRTPVSLNTQSEFYRDFHKILNPSPSQVTTHGDIGTRFFSDGSKFVQAKADLPILVFGPGNPDE